VLFAGENRLLEMVAEGRALSETLEAICRLAERAIGGSVCSFTLVDQRSRGPQNAARSRLLASLNRSTAGHPVGLGSGRPEAAPLPSKPTCWSRPVATAAGEVLGVFSIYGYTGARRARDQAFADRFARIAVIAIEGARREAALRRSETLLPMVQHLARTGSLVWHLSTDQLTWSDEIYSIFEVEPPAAVTLELILSRVHPADVPAFLAMHSRALADVGSFEH